MTGTLAPVAWILVSVLAGVAAAAVTCYPMFRGIDGVVPAYVATALITHQSMDTVRLRDALVVHHGIGAVAGLMYAGVFLAVAMATPAFVSFPGGVGLFPHLIAISLLVVVLHWTFSNLVFPRADGTPYEERVTAVQGRWLRALLVFGTTMALAVPAFASAMG